MIDNSATISKYVSYLFLLLPSAYGHMVLSWARGGNGQLDSDLEGEFSAAAMM